MAKRKAAAIPRPDNLTERQHNWLHRQLEELRNRSPQQLDTLDVFVKATPLEVVAELFRTGKLAVRTPLRKRDRYGQRNPECDVRQFFTLAVKGGPGLIAPDTAYEINSKIRDRCTELHRRRVAALERRVLSGGGTFDEYASAVDELAGRKPPADVTQEQLVTELRKLRDSLVAKLRP